MEVVILMGLQASGKSTFYRERLFNTHMRISLDMLRTRHRENLLFEACLAAKQACAIDNTNPRVADRAPYIAAARAAGFRVVGYYFRSRLDECQVRNQTRPGKQAIPLGGLRGTAARLELPSKVEGFHELHYVYIGSDGRFVVEDWSDEI
jgi:predicted kinase